MTFAQPLYRLQRLCTDQPEIVGKLNFCSGGIVAWVKSTESAAQVVLLDGEQLNIRTEKINVRTKCPNSSAPSRISRTQWSQTVAVGPITAMKGAERLLNLRPPALIRSKLKHSKRESQTPEPWLVLTSKCPSKAQNLRSKGGCRSGAWHSLPGRSAPIPPSPPVVTSFVVT